MLFSLIVPTLNRKDYLIKLFESLDKQELRDFEVIIVDQNPIGFLDSIISNWDKRLNLIYKHVNFKGACRGRNYGIKFAKGEYVAFPDDDTEYPRKTLSLLAKEFSTRKEFDILITDCVDQKNKETHLNHTRKVYYIKSIFSLLKARIVTSQIFTRKSIIDSFHNEIFDEKMGPGSDTPYASNDETDFLIKSLKAKKKIYLDRNIYILHPTHYPNYKKAYYYGLGRFRLIQKHNIGIIFYLINILQPLLRLILTLDFKRSRSYIASSLGRSGIQILLNEICDH